MSHRESATGKQVEILLYYTRDHFSSTCQYYIKWVELSGGLALKNRIRFPRLRCVLL